jgi:uncharacterized protein (DUF1800 family)
MAHLMRRAGFSCSSDELAARVQKGLDATISELLYYEDTPDIADLFDPDKRNPDSLDLTTIQTYWLNRMVKTTRPLQEKMTLFWHGHFATAYSKVQNGLYMIRQNRFFRQNALGTFGEILLGVSKDPAMLVWLDNVSNDKKAPNENYAREVMELFSLGRGNYTEDDIKNGAKAFTGWQIKNDHFWIDILDHDFRPKTILGVQGKLNGDDMIEIILQQPVAARFIAQKLLRFFATDTPDGAWVYRIAQAFSQSGGSLRATMEAILRSPEFYSDAVMNAQFKSPAEFVVGAIRETGMRYALRNITPYLAAMGQDLFNPPTVKGWDGGRNWMNTAAMLARINFAGYLTGQQSGSYTAKALYQYLTDREIRSADDVLAHYQDRLGGLRLSQETQDYLRIYLNSSSSGIKGPFKLTQTSADIKVRNALRLMISSPEYQFN